MRSILILFVVYLIPLQITFSQSFTTSGTDILWQLRPSVINEAGVLDESVFVMDYLVYNQALIILISTSPVEYHLNSYDLETGSLNWSQLIALAEEKIIFADLDIVAGEIMVTGNALFAYPSLSTLGMYTNKVFNPDDGQLLNSFTTTFVENPGLFVEGLLLFNYKSQNKFKFLRSTLTGSIYTWSVIESNDEAADTLLLYETTSFEFPTDLGLYSFKDGNNVLLTHNLRDPNIFAATSTKGIYFDDIGVVSDTLDLEEPTGYLQFPFSTFINDKVFIMGNRGFVDTVSYDGRISVYNSFGEILFSEVITKNGAPFNVTGMMGDTKEQYYILTRETDANRYTEGLFMNSWAIGDLVLEEAYSITSSRPFSTYLTRNRLYTDGEFNVHIIELKEYENEGANFFGEQPIREGDEIVVTKSTTTSATPNIAFNAVKVFPNPTTGKCQILGLPTDAWIDVYNMNGKRQLTKKVNQGNEIDISGLHNGIYFLHVQQTNSIAVSKIILQR
ncbi:MAG: T9SS type A sorting domain-containing protein [Bacteroidia bacterium]|nr:T9SS type A sorting domain-containing protein [Bacteroidia bacterium]